MSSADIRPASPGDVAAITRIYGEAVANGTATFEIEPPPEAEMARRLEGLLAKNFPYLVAEQAGGVAGYAYVGALPRPAGVPVERRGLGLCRAGISAPGIGPAPPGAADRRRRGARFPPDDRGRSATRRTPHRSHCTPLPVSAASARCNRSASSTGAGSTPC